MEPTNDHDLLLTFKAEVATKLDRVISDVKELKENFAARVTALEEEKANKKDFDDFKKSTNSILDTLKKFVYIGLGIVITVEFVIIAYVTYHHS